MKTLVRIAVLVSMVIYGQLTLSMNENNRTIVLGRNYFQWSSMQGALSQEDELKEAKSSTVSIKHGVAEMQGQRWEMQDAHRNIPENGFFSIYDGHGTDGKAVADFAAKHLYAHCELAGVEKTDDIIEVLRKGFLRTHAGLAYEMNGGTTAIVSLICKGQLFTASVGDSRGVLCSGGQAVSLSDDHKPDRADEKKRIEALGGSVVYVEGIPRIDGLAVSRALGDRDRHPYVIADPEITHRNLAPEDDFLILACDGVWDVFDNQQAVNVVQGALRNYQNDFDRAAMVLRDAAYQAGSTDNISVIVINLKIIH